MADTNDRVEYWLRTPEDEPDRCILSLKSAIVPRQGEKVNIRKTNYVVVFVSYAMDYTDTPFPFACATVALQLDTPQ